MPLLANGMSMQTLTLRIEAVIADGALKSGDRLPPERRLAEDLGVSRPRLREAIQHLVSRGILRSRQGGGTFVAAAPGAVALESALAPLSALVRVDPGYGRDVMEIRRSLEGDAAYHAALRATDEDRAQLADALAAVSSISADDHAAQAEADAAFHMAVASASHNAVLRQVMVGLFDLLKASISDSLVQLYRLPSTVETLEQQHRRIVEEIQAGHADAARAAAIAHLDFVDRSLRQIEEAAGRQRRSSRALMQTTSDQG